MKNLKRFDADSHVYKVIMNINVKVTRKKTIFFYIKDFFNQNTYDTFESLKSASGSADGLPH